MFPMVCWMVMPKEPAFQPVDIPALERRMAEIRADQEMVAAWTAHFRVQKQYNDENQEIDNEYRRRSDANNVFWRPLQAELREAERTGRNMPDIQVRSRKLGQQMTRDFEWYREAQRQLNEKYAAPTPK